MTDPEAEVTTRDEYPCPICGGPRPWHVWFSRDGKGCHHAVSDTTSRAVAEPVEGDVSGATVR